MSEKRIWLLQKGTWNKDVNKEDASFDDLIDFKYMRASEYELAETYENGKIKFVNPLYLSLRRMVKEKENFEYIKMLKRKDSLGNQMYIFCRTEDQDELKELLRKTIKNPYLKRSAGLTNYIEADKEALSNPDHYYCNFWWDIENDMLIFFGDNRIETLEKAFAVLHERWKEELFPPEKKTFIQKIKGFFVKTA